MLLYIFRDAVTGETQQPFLAHNDDEAIRIARMAFAPVPREIVRDLYVGHVVFYDPADDPAFKLDPIYHGIDFIREIDACETEDNND